MVRVLVFCLFLAGCAAAGTKTYVSPSYTPAQFELDRTVCVGETQKAGLSSDRPGVYLGLVGEIASAQQRGQSMSQIYDGCMAARGYHVEMR